MQEYFPFFKSCQRALCRCGYGPDYNFTTFHRLDKTRGEGVDFPFVVCCNNDYMLLVVKDLGTDPKNKRNLTFFNPPDVKFT